MGGDGVEKVEKWKDVRLLSTATRPANKRLGVTKLNCVTYVILFLSFGTAAYREHSSHRKHPVTNNVIKQASMRSEDDARSDNTRVDGVEHQPLYHPVCPSLTHVR